MKPTTTGMRCGFCERAPAVAGLVRPEWGTVCASCAAALDALAERLATEPYCGACLEWATACVCAPPRALDDPAIAHPERCRCGACR